MKRLRWILFYLSLTISTFAQNYTISVTVKGLPSYPLLLTDFYGDKNSIIDTVKTNTLGKAVYITCKSAGRDVQNSFQR